MYYFGFGGPFNLYNMPRQLIRWKAKFPANVPLALVVEEAKDAPDPIDYLSTVQTTLYLAM